MSGRLVGVGVGPGDPELMTLKAHRLIQGAGVVAYPAPLTAAGVGESFARAIAAGAIASGTEEIAIPVPMQAARAPAQAAYDAGAATIAERLSAGRDVVALCEGDPLFYGSFMYLMARLSGRFDVEIVPGVSSLMACAAAAGRPICARNEGLRVVSGAQEGAALAATLAEVAARGEAAAILKVGRRLSAIRAAASAAGLLEGAVYVARAGLAEQVVAPLAEAPEDAPYFSMILIGSRDGYAGGAG